VSKNLGTISIKSLEGFMRKWINFLLMGLIFVFFRTPDLDKINYNLGSNYDATAGESANQVATYLSLGLLLSLYFIIKKKYFSGNIWIDITVMLLFVFQSLLTFSRGGIIVATMAILWYLYKTKKIIFSFKNAVTFFFMVFLFFIVFDFIDSKSKGTLTNRYKGETEATLMGRKEKNLNVITSNRLQVIEQNFLIFKSNIWGIGTSNGTSYRADLSGRLIADHTEFSRWLVEYGVFGILILFWFSSISFKLLRHGNISVSQMLFLVSTLTMFHSATRTFVSFVPLIVSHIRIKRD
jgi:hypothetical protein